jgi:thymidylate synthase (FAD)
MPDPFICDNSYSFNHVDVDTALWMESLLNSEASYLRLLELGWQPQQARAVLPNSLKTEINMKANIREWRHIFRLRCSPKAHPQMRELMIPLLQHFQRFAPELFNDITYE